MSEPPEWRHLAHRWGGSVGRRDLVCRGALRRRRRLLHTVHQGRDPRPRLRRDRRVHLVAASDGHAAVQRAGPALVVGCVRTCLAGGVVGAAGRLACRGDQRGRTAARHGGPRRRRPARPSRQTLERHRVGPGCGMADRAVGECRGLGRRRRQRARSQRSPSRSCRGCTARTPTSGSAWRGSCCHTTTSPTG